MVIREIDSSETKLVVDLFDKYRVFYEQTSDRELARQFIQARSDNKESVIFVTIIKDKGVQIPAGFTQLYPIFSSVRLVKNWILNDLFVENDYRNKGIGEALIRKAMEFARKDGATFVQLSTAVDNFKAQRLYKNIGFKKQAHSTDFYTYRINLT